jgi:hypothetical protein
MIRVKVKPLCLFSKVSVFICAVRSSVIMITGGGGGGLSLALSVCLQIPQREAQIRFLSLCV